MSPRAEILSARDPQDAERWDELISQAPGADVYYRHGYALAYDEAGHGQATAVVLDLGDARFLVPLLIRKLTGFPELDQCYDAFSPYGYGGMIALTPTTYSRDLLVRFAEALRNWARECNIISCILRLHPMETQSAAWSALTEPALGGSVTVVNRGPTVSLDLRSWDVARDCIADLGKGRRSDLAMARRHLRVTWSDQGDLDEAIEIFRGIYESTMLRLSADPFFFFPRTYYRALARQLRERFGIAIAWYGDQPAGAAVFFRDCNYGHYHLSGTNELGRRHRAATLLINAGAAWCRAFGSKALHLGGGMRMEDSLFQFKRSFGGEVHSYVFVRLVCDKARFATLAQDPTARWLYTETATASTEGSARARAVPEPVAHVEAARSAVRLPAVVHAANAGSETVLRPAERSVAGITADMVRASARPVVLGIGAGGHAKVVLNILRQNGKFDVIGLIDSSAALWNSEVEGVRVLGGEELLEDLKSLGVERLFVGIGGVGDNRPRARAYLRMRGMGFELVNAVHPTAVVSSSAKLGRALVIAAAAVVNADAVVGDNVIINTGAIVEHDCQVGDHVHVAPGACISAGVVIETGAHIGTGAAVRQGVRIGEWAVVGAGAVVLHDVTARTTMVGVPAQPLVRRHAGR